MMNKEVLFESIFIIAACIANLFPEGFAECHLSIHYHYYFHMPQ